jgi:UDP-N-acetylglucosamine transferase subunit ALG13
MGTVFVTVGTTKFDALVQAVDSQEVADTLVRRGYSKLVVQKGAGAYVPHVIVPAGGCSSKLPSGLSVEVFDFSPSLATYISSAALVISHAGSGSIFETLTAGERRVTIAAAWYSAVSPCLWLAAPQSAAGVLTGARPSWVNSLQCHADRTTLPFPCAIVLVA